MLGAERLECEFSDNGEGGSRHGPLKDEADVVECQSGNNRLPQAARPDEDVY